MDQTYLERVKNYKPEMFPILIELCDTRAKAVVERVECVPEDISFYVIAVKYHPIKPLLN